MSRLQSSIQGGIQNNPNFPGGEDEDDIDLDDYDDEEPDVTEREPNQNQSAHGLKRKSRLSYLLKGYVDSSLFKKDASHGLSFEKLKYSINKSHHRITDMEPGSKYP